MDTLFELIGIRDRMDHVLANDPSLVVQAELYSSRIFLVRAIREQAAVEVRTYVSPLACVEKGIEA